jgi:hypothetical protein
MKRAKEKQEIAIAEGTYKEKSLSPNSINLW